MQGDERAAKARGLAEWFRTVAREDARDGLMDRIASLLEQEAADEPQDVVPDIRPAVLVTRPAGHACAANDNAKGMRRRTK